MYACYHMHYKPFPDNILSLGFARHASLWSRFEYFWRYLYGVQFQFYIFLSKKNKKKYHIELHWRNCNRSNQQIDKILIRKHNFEIPLMPFVWVSFQITIKLLFNERSYTSSKWTCSISRYHISWCLFPKIKQSKEQEVLS